MNRPERYYAYSPALGRKRWGGDDLGARAVAAATVWADDIGADNLVREEGPQSKPTAATVVWERHPKSASAARISARTDRWGERTVAVAMASVGSFEFVATGHNRQAALDALNAAWHAHADQYGIDPDRNLAEEVAIVVEGPLGSAFRDGLRMDI